MPELVPGSGTDHSSAGRALRMPAAGGGSEQGRRELVDRSVSGGELSGVAQCLHHGRSPRRRRCARPAGAAPARTGPHPTAAVGVDVRVVVGEVGVPASRAGAMGGRRAHGVLRWGSCRGVSLRRLCRRGGGTGRHPRAGIGATWGEESAPRGAYLWRRRPVTVERTHRRRRPRRCAIQPLAAEEERRCVHGRCCTPYLWR
jgi:hypothetical protein